MPDELPPTASSVTSSDSVPSAAGDDATEEVALAETPSVEEATPAESTAGLEPAVPDNTTTEKLEGKEDLAAVETTAAEMEPASEVTPEVSSEAESEPVVASSLADDDDGPDAPIEVPDVDDAEIPAEEAPVSNKQWYVVKVQSGREDSIRANIERKIRIEGLEEFFGQIIIPVERIQELRRGKRVTKAIKLYPGYLFAEVEFNDRILYVFREVSGVGDFVGGGPLGKAPTPMRAEEVERMLNRQPTTEKPGEEGATEKPREVIRTRPRFSVGDRLKVTDGNFSGMDGEVIDITEDRVKLQVLVLGMPVSIDLEFWQVETE